VTGAAVALLLAAVTLAVAQSDAGPASLWRHAYHAPVALAAVRWGGRGLLVALAAVLLWAPFVLPALERSGPTPEVLEGLATFGFLLGSGALSATLTSRARRQGARYETLVAVGRAIGGAGGLDAALDRVGACLAPRLGGAVGLAVRDGGRFAVAGGVAVHPDSPVARVVAGGPPCFESDAGGGPRPRRLFVVPISAAGATLGALALEREGDIAGDERAALLALGAHLGLALEHARLGARQRRFAAELAGKVAEATRRVVEMDRMKSDFVAVASHELRTPLTALQGFSELLATRRFAPSEVARLGAIMAGETERLGRIVSDFLDLARLERGLAPPLRRRQVDVGALVGDAVEVLRRARSTHRFDVECAGALPPLEADPDALDRVVKNLVANAVKYSPPGSRVAIRAGRGPAPPPTVEIVVEDEGPGIAEADLARVFEPYYRAPGTAGAAVGAGLGLAVVKSLVDAHGGTIRAENRAPRGTRMTLTLPAVS
jgi:signal transduction histidine kinase